MDASLGTYSGLMKFRMYRYALTGSLPLRVGARLKTGSTLMEISEVSREPDDIIVSWRGRSIGEGDFVFYVINRQLRQVLGATKSGGRLSQGRDMILPGATISYWTQFLKIDLKHNLYPFAVDQLWLADAELLIAERQDAGQFNRQFQIHDFRISENTLEQWEKRLRKQ